MKHLLTLLVFISTSLMADETLVPLKDYTTNKPNWQSNAYEIYYVATRCALATHAAYEEMLKHNKEEALDRLHDRGYNMAVNAVLYLEENTNKAFYFSIYEEQKLESLFSFYQDEAKKSYIENNKFKGIIGSDIITCDGYESFYHSLVQWVV